MTKTIIDNVLEDYSNSFILISGQIYHHNSNHRYMAAGDVKSLLSAVLTIQQVLKIKIKHRFSNAIIPDQDLKNKNIISVGGPKFNFITRTLLDRYNELDDFLIEFNNNNVIVSYFKDAKMNVNELKYQKMNDIVIQDYGVIIKSRNPFDISKSVWILAGCGNNGVWAAAEFFSQYFSKQTMFDQSKTEILVLKVNLFKGEYVSSSLILHASYCENNWKFHLDDLHTIISPNDFICSEEEQTIVTERITISIEQEHIKILDKISKKHRISREHFIEKLVKSEINHYQRHLS